MVSNQMNFQRLILPVVTLAIAMRKYARQVRAAILEELRQDYVAGARARGCRNDACSGAMCFQTLFCPHHHAGAVFGFLLGGTAVVEVIFSYPALGSLAISAITSRDYPLIQGYVLWIALIYMAVNLVVDLSYNRLDPRLRKELQA
ncbi:MAG: ABC transporter permease [Eubacteriales bacterium]